LVGISDAVKYTKFGDDRLRGLEESSGQIFPFFVGLSGSRLTCIISEARYWPKIAIFSRSTKMQELTITVRTTKNHGMVLQDLTMTVNSQCCQRYAID